MQSGSDPGQQKMLSRHVSVPFTHSPEDDELDDPPELDELDEDVSPLELEEEDEPDDEELLDDGSQKAVCGQDSYSPVTGLNPKQVCVFPSQAGS